jgi:hypothetical protein
VFRYRLRTLLIVLALGPPLLAWGWHAYRDHLRSLEKATKPQLGLNFGGIIPRIIVQPEEEQKLGIEPVEP